MQEALIGWFEGLRAMEPSRRIVEELLVVYSVLRSSYDNFA